MYTVSYEAAMELCKYPLSGMRPDLLAFTHNDKFAIEAKGFSRSNISNDDMIKYKKQSKSGPITVDFTVASVAYNLYNNIKCKYYDPTRSHDNDNNKNLLTELTKVYYSEIYTFYMDYMENSTSEYIESNFIEIKLNKDISLIIPRNIQEYAENGLNNNFQPFLNDTSDDRLYIDNDGIGVKIR